MLLLLEGLDLIPEESESPATVKRVCLIKEPRTKRFHSVTREGKSVPNRQLPKEGQGGKRNPKLAPPE
jgi:hypothetical protein